MVRTMAFCTACGANLVDGAKFCSECGARVGAPIPTTAVSRGSASGSRRPWGLQLVAIVAGAVMCLGIVGLLLDGGEDRTSNAGTFGTSGTSVPSTTEPQPPSSQEEPPATVSSGPPPPPTFVVERVIDGDTIELASGKRVRLLQIDAPEMGGECFSAKSSGILEQALPPGTEVRLRTDPRLDRTDRYGRLLRYVFAGSSNLNLMLVKRGAAAPYFFFGERGRYASQLMSSARAARTAKRGLWGTCKGTELDPSHQVSAVRALPLPPPPPEPASNCHSSYVGECLDPSLSDYDCAGGSGNGPGYVQSTVRVVGPDDYGLDGDDDGYGCE
jgi:endonuclease YncB( thermonuclease family)